MKRLIVIFLILLLVAGGGAGALIMLGIVPNPFAAPKPAKTADKGAPVADSKHFQAPLSAYVQVKLDDLIVPVIINGQVTRRVYISARIIAARRDLSDGVTARISEYQNAVIADLVPFFSDYFQDHTTVDLAVIKDRLTKHAKQIYGDSVTDVLLMNVFDQSLGRSADAR